MNAIMMTFKKKIFLKWITDTKTCVKPIDEEEKGIIPALCNSW